MPKALLTFEDKATGFWGIKSSSRARSHWFESDGHRNVPMLRSACGKWHSDDITGVDIWQSTRKQCGRCISILIERDTNLPDGDQIAQELTVNLGGPSSREPGMPTPPWVLVANAIGEDSMPKSRFAGLFEPDGGAFGGLGVFVPPISDEFANGQLG